MKRGVVLALMTALISGFSIFINKLGVTGMNPFMFTFMKNLLVGVFLFSIIILARNFNEFKLLRIKDWSKLMLIGLVGGSVPFLMFFYGLKLASAITASFIHKTMFIFVAILAMAFLKEKLNRNFLIGAALLVIANFLLISLKSFSFGLGEALILGATILWSTEIIISKHTLKNLSGNIVAFSRMFFGSLFILIFLLATNNFTLSLAPAQISWTLITSLLLLGYVTTFYNALKLEKASIVTPILLLGSFITLALNSIYSGNLLSIPHVIGSIAMFSGLYYIIKEKISIPLND